MRAPWPPYGFILVLLCAAPAARAGLCTAAPPLPEPRHEFEFFAGYSPASATLIGTTTDRRFVLAGFSYSYSCWEHQHVSIAYTASLMPAAIVLQPAERSGDFLLGGQPAHAVYGVAVAPLGFTFEFRPGHRLRPFAEWMGGLIASTEPIPENAPDATGLNFMFDLGAGVRWELHGGRRAFSLGYKFLHISNAQTTDYNPGLDNNVIYAGFSFLR